MNGREIYQNNKEFFDKLSNMIMESEFSPVREVYIDLCELKDLRLGLVLSRCNDEQKKYVIANIDKYNNKPNRSFLWGFDDLHMNEKELQTLYSQPQNWDSMFNNAPDTELSAVLGGFNELFLARNARASYDNPVVYYINSYPIKKSKLLDIYIKLLSRYLKGRPAVQSICKDPRELDSGFWTYKDFIVFDDLNILETPDTGIYKELFVEQSMIGKKIFAPYQVSAERYAEWQKMYKKFPPLSELFTPTEMALSTVCQFKFVPCTIPSVSR